jgi:hypothetical protein
MEQPLPFDAQHARDRHEDAGGDEAGHDHVPNYSLKGSGGLSAGGHAEGEVSGEVGADLTGLERARGAGRRLSEFSRAAEEGELTGEQFLFLRAIDDFKRVNQKTYPSWTDVLEVVRLLGYRKVQASVISLRGVADWQEKPDAAAGVRPRNWEHRFGAEGHGATSQPLPGAPTKHADAHRGPQHGPGKGKKKAA